MIAASLTALGRRCPPAVLAALLVLLSACGGAQDADPFDLIVRGGTIYDGSGLPGYVGDVAIRGDRIAYVGPRAPGPAARVIDARGRAVAPGFINLLSWSNEALLHDGLGQSALRQGVTLEVMGEGSSMGPLTLAMRAQLIARQRDIRYAVDWTTLGEYLETLERRGVALNVASYLGAATARMMVLGTDDVDPTPDQLDRMRAVVRQAMEDGALGVASSLIYPPGVYAETDELVALAGQAGRCGGLYATHLRSEGNRFLQAVDEAIAIGRRAATPVEIFHLKVGGRHNWDKMGDAVARIEAARAAGIRVTTDMYVYDASGTALTASMPPWVQAGGFDAMAERLADPSVRRRVIADMRAASPGWDNVMAMAGGPDRVMLAAVGSDALRPLIGQTMAQIARDAGKTPEDALIDLVLADGGRPAAVYFTMSEDTIRDLVGLPYMSFASDGVAMAPEGDFLKSNTHPRSYGNFARVFARYVRELELLGVAEAVRRMTALPADVLALPDRGRLRVGHAADVVVFDPDAIQDHATYVSPHRFATGVDTVLVNGVPALEGGVPTGATPGRVVRGRAWRGFADGGCRAEPADWRWAWPARGEGSGGPR